MPVYPGALRLADNPGAIARCPTPAAWIRLRQGARNHQGDVILLFATAAELLHRLNNCLEKWSHGKVKIAPKGRQQMGLAELFPIGVCGFGNPIRVEHQHVTWSK